MEERIAFLEAKVRELTDYVEKRKVQQIAYPLDDASRNTMRVVTVFGPGSSALTENKAISSTPTNITVPAAFAGSLVINSEGANYEVPYL